MIDRIKSYVPKLASGIGRLMLLVMCLSPLVLIVRSFDRGLGMYDEGNYLLAARFPDEIKVSSTSAYLFTGMLFRLLNYDVFLFRLSGLILMLYSWVILSRGFTKIASLWPPEVSILLREKGYSLGFVLLGVLLYYQWFLPTPSLNQLTAIAVNACCGFFLMALADLSSAKSLTLRRGLCFAAAGAHIALSFFIKFSTGICLAAIFFLVIACWDDLKTSVRLRGIGAIVAGFACVCLIYFALLQRPVEWLYMFKGGLDYSTQTHMPISILGAYLSQLRPTFLRAFDYSWPALLMFFVWSAIKVLFRKKFPKLISLSPWCVTAVMAFFAGRCWALNLHTRENLFGQNVFCFYLAWLFLLGVVLVVSLLTNAGGVRFFPKSAFRRILLVLFVLCSMPFAGMMGTVNHFYLNAQLFWGAWMALIAVLLAFVAVWQRGAFIFRCGVLCIGFFASHQIMWGALYAPVYLGRNNLMNQTIPVSLGHPSTKLFLDPETSEIVLGMKTIAKSAGFQPGDDILAFDLLPALVYALGGKSPGILFYRTDEFISTSRKGLSLAGDARARQAFVITQAESISEVSALLQSFGLPFPEGYINFGAARTKSGRAFFLWKPGTNVRSVRKPLYRNDKLTEIAGGEPYAQVGIPLPRMLARNNVYVLTMDYQTLGAPVPYVIVIQSPYTPENIPLHRPLTLSAEYASVQLLFVPALDIRVPILILRNWSKEGRFIVKTVTIDELGMASP